ncbi:protein AMBP [Thalassophryne amazonica]|uniref:protein AMBP n=1 Tax=Thalassophryne amazonica TaxID=390379 RepID=UPI0014709A91|nr:protein AMBP [Thalassophryne amazonica]
MFCPFEKTMQKLACLLLLLVLGWAWTLHGIPVVPGPLDITQENFVLDQFLGTWYEVAVVSTCPHYMQRKRGKPIVIALELQHVPSESKISVTASTFRDGWCNQTSTNYSLTDTPGRFFYHIARLNADVDSCVTRTNYDEYAMMTLLSTEKLSGTKTTTFKLYSRTTDVNATVLDEFKTLITTRGLSDESIIINRNKGQCIPDGDRNPSHPGRQTDKMQKAVRLVSLLVLGWALTLQGLPILPEPLYATQENFDVDQILGTWYYIAMATTNTIHHHHEGVGTAKLVMEHSITEGKLNITMTGFSHGTCKEISGEYEMTSTPGRFLYHVPNRGVDVDVYVVHTNYNEYGIAIMNSIHQGDNSTSLKLYSRTTGVRATVLEDFKTLAKELGISNDNIIITKNKGDCVPGQQMAALQTEPKVQVMQQRQRRNVVLATVAVDTDGSGAGPMLFNPEDCKATPDSGPCFGLFPRYYYNSTTMTCDLFNFGGCMGNHNNFLTERGCLQRCRTEAVCRLPMAAKPCTGQAPHWAFDSTSGLCVPYKQGFCQTNGNKFYTKAECEEYCGVVKDDDELLKVN